MAKESEKVHSLYRWTNLEAILPQGKGKEGVGVDCVGGGGGGLCRWGFCHLCSHLFNSILLQIVSIAFV